MPDQMFINCVVQAKLLEQEQEMTDLEATLNTKLTEAQEQTTAAQAEAAAKAAEDAARFQAELDRLAADREQQRTDYDLAAGLHTREMADALERYERETQKNHTALEAVQRELEGERSKGADARVQLTSAAEALAAERSARGAAEARVAQLDERVAQHEARAEASRAEVCPCAVFLHGDRDAGNRPDLSSCCAQCLQACRLSSMRRMPRQRARHWRRRAAS